MNTKNDLDLIIKKSNSICNNFLNIIKIQEEKGYSICLKKKSLNM